MPKKIILVVLLCYCFALANAQAPANDNCENAIALGVVPACPTAIFSNLNATATNIGDNNNTFCADDGNVSRDVWFTFTTTNDVAEYEIKVKSSGQNGIKGANISVFRGACGINNLAKLCIDTLNSSPNEMTMLARGLSPSVTYYVRVSDAISAGDFTICVKKFELTTMKNGSSDACAGTIYDSGGPNKPYKNNENYKYTICSDVTHRCIAFTLTKYYLEVGEKLIFYNGSDTTAPILRKIDGIDFNTAFNTGGVDFNVYANAPCLTIQFISNANEVAEGFEGKWQCSQNQCPIFEDIDFKTNPTENEILTSVSRPGTDVKISRISCGTDKENYGIFNTTDNSELGLSSGIVLTTGKISSINQAANFIANTRLDIEGDKDLDSLSLSSGGSVSKDACSIEFEVFANTDEISFDYVFGSEEYPDFISDPKFNDIFALMIEGPGIQGDAFINPKENLARLPDGTPIAINEVNHGYNYEYYRNNYDGKKIVFNGLTAAKNGTQKYLTAKSKVIPCNTYKLKMAIGDRGDGKMDSGVFIGNIKSTTPEIGFKSGIGLDGLIEQCSNNADNLIIKLNGSSTKNETYIVTISGTANQGIDYITTLPNVLNIPSGTTEVSFPISIINDNITEGEETITISISKDFGCGLKTIASKTISIKDNISLDIQDTVNVCSAGNGVHVKAKGATNYVWSPISAFEEPYEATTFFTPKLSGWYYVQGIAGLCSVKDSFYANVIAPTLKIAALGDAKVCENTPIILQANNNFGNQNIKWQPDVFVASQTGNRVIIKADMSATITATALVGGCSVADSFDIEILAVNMPNIVRTDTVCYKEKTLIAYKTDAPNTTFEWTPIGLTDPKKDNVYITPTQDITYILKGTTQQCTVFDTINVYVNGKLDINTKDTIQVCKGSSVAVSASLSNNTTPNQVNFRWFAKNTLINSPNNLTTNIQPAKSGWLFAEAKYKNCIIKDSVFVSVDSLPTLTSIKAIQQKMLYCQGDTILFYSDASFPKNLYPYANYQWQAPINNALSPLDKVNLKIVAQKTQTYVRTISNGACVLKDSIQIVVLPPSSAIAVSDVTLCEGKSAELTIKNAADYDNFKWSPSDKLSCADCASPTTTTAGNYTIVATRTGECPQSKTISVSISDPIKLSAYNDKFCDASSINTTVNILNFKTVSWSPIDGLSCADCPNPTITKAGTYTVTEKLCNSKATVTIVALNEKIDILDKYVICDDKPIAIPIAKPANFDTLYIGKWKVYKDTTLRLPSYGKYTVSGTSKNGCFFTKQLELIQAKKVEISISASPYNVSLNGSKITLEAKTNQNKGTLLWFDNSAEDKINVFPKDTATTYSVRVLGEEGCWNEAYITIYNVLAPTIFTPQANSNTTFDLYKTPKQFTFNGLVVFNRWGNEVFRNAKDSTWDGTSDGTPLPSDVYVYTIRLNHNIILKGEITLLR